MAELKHTFTSGRMNKDLDDRLVPNGEYIDALNIQVSSSEGSDVGAIENILGNVLVGNANIPNGEAIGVYRDTGNETVNITGLGFTSVTYDDATNTIYIFSEGGGSGSGSGSKLE